jgi:hypothetical protein
MNLNEAVQESSSKTIGQIETSSITEATATLVNLMSSMGMANPTAPTNTSAKGVSIQKKGDSYVITLSMFTPPITFVWTGLTPTKELTQVIAKIIEEKKKIGMINQVKTSDGTDLVQLGIIN